MSSTISQSTITSKRRVIAYAAAAAASGLLHGVSAEMTPSSDAITTTSSASTALTRLKIQTNNHDIHETLWGNPEVWQEEPEPCNRYVDLSSLNIPRGGTDFEQQEDDDEDELQQKSTLPSSPKKKKGKSPHHKKKKKRQTNNSTPNNNNNNNNNNTSKAKTTTANEKDKHHSTKEHESSSAGRRHESSPSATSPTAQPKQQQPQQPRNPMMEEILKCNDYYDILELPRGEDNPARIKKAYRSRAVKTHPDKTGGDRRAFDKLAEAYDVLLDDNKRALYDRFGKEGLDPTFSAGRSGGLFAEDLFGSFFGFSPSQQQQQQQQQRRGPTVNRTLRYQLEVTLEDLYNGKTRRVTVEAPSDHPMRGLFYVPPPEESKKKQVEVTIPRGGHPGQSIVLSGEMDFDSHDSPPGDLIFQLHPRPHKIFTRKGHDLAMEMRISFQEAICGCTRTIQHLDGRTIIVESAKHHPQQQATTATSSMSSINKTDSTLREEETPANVYIQTGDVQVLKGQGMPKNSQGTEFGDLYIQYVVDLPQSGSTERLTPSERAELARLLEKLESGNSNRHKSSNLQQQQQQQQQHHGGGFNNIIGAKKIPGPASSPQQHYKLEPAKLSDFGHASGPVPPHSLDEDHHHDPHLHDDYQQQQQQQQQHPFSYHFPFGGTGHRQFFFSSSSGRNPFSGNDDNNHEEDDNVQCRQM